MSANNLTHVQRIQLDQIAGKPLAEELLATDRHLPPQDWFALRSAASEAGLDNPGQWADSVRDGRVTPFKFAEELVAPKNPVI